MADPNVPTDNTTEAIPAGPMLAEVASPLVDARSRFVSDIAESRDEVLRTHGGGNIETYAKLLQDDQVQATFHQRRTAVVAMPWCVDPGGDSALDQAAADDLREQLKNVSFDAATYKMLAGLMYGYNVAELMYGIDGTRVRLNEIRVRRASRFRFRNDGHLMLKSSGELVPMPPAKFWVYTCGADDDDDFYGRGLGYWLYWPVWFKRNAWRFWALWLEKLASGTPVAKGPAGMNDKEQNQLLGILDAVTNGGKVVIPKSVELSLLEAARNSGGDYDVFTSKMDAAISKLIVAQTMTTEDGSSLGQAAVHYKVFGKVAQGDSDLVCESFVRGPATWLTTWNFPGAKTPLVYRDGSEPEDLAARADRDTKIKGLGYSPTPEYITETYGDGWVKDAAPTADPIGATPGATSFADPKPPTSTADALDDLLSGGGWRDVIGPQVDDVEALLKDAKDLEEVQARLGELMQKDPKRFADSLGRVMFAGKTLGLAGGETNES